MTVARATSATLQLSRTDARRLAIVGQRLAGPRPSATRAGILRVIRDLGYLQLDPTNVVARNPSLVLWSRLGRFDPRILDDLLAKHRELYESPSLILPVSDLAMHVAPERAPQTVPGLRRGPSSMDLWRTRRADWLRRNDALRRRVMARLRRDGPLPLSAFEDRAIVSWTSGDHDDDNNVTRMLAILQRRGEVVVAGRRGGQKLWGIAEGWLPRVRPMSDPARAREATLRALRACGVATVRHLAWYYAFNQHITKDAVASLEREGEIVRLEVDGAAGVFYATRDIARRLRDVRERWEGRTTLLSPFDSLIHDRARLEQLFDYFYRIEIYTPIAKRRLGYWAMPILHGDRIVGSVDPRVDRERGVLVVNRVVLSEGATARTRAAMRAAVEDLAVFAGARRVDWPARSS